MQFIQSKPNGNVTVRSNLSRGKAISYLSWLSSSSVACFPGTRNVKFTGNHVLFATRLPRYAEMEIQVTPDNKNANLSLYACFISTLDYSSVVPDFIYCTSCEADCKWDYPKGGKIQTHRRKVSLDTTTAFYNIIIGVAGVDKLKSASFTLSMKIKDGEEQT